MEIKHNDLLAKKEQQFQELQQERLKLRATEKELSQRQKKTDELQEDIKTIKHKLELRNKENELQYESIQKKDADLKERNKQIQSLWTFQNRFIQEIQGKDAELQYRETQSKVILDAFVNSDRNSDPTIIKKQAYLETASREKEENITELKKENELMAEGLADVTKRHKQKLDSSALFQHCKQLEQQIQNSQVKITEPELLLTESQETLKLNCECKEISKNPRNNTSKQLKTIHAELQNQAEQNTKLIDQDKDLQLQLQNFISDLELQIKDDAEKYRKQIRSLIPHNPQFDFLVD